VGKSVYRLVLAGDLGGVSSRKLTRRLVQCLRQGCISVKRLRVIIRTLHPLLAATNYSWSKKEPEVGRIEVFHELVQSDVFQDSPLRRIFEGMSGVRWWISVENEDDFTVLADLRAKGVTYYVAMSMISSDGQINALTMSTGPTGRLYGRQSRVFPRGVAGAELLL
jgi:hypothetical protein